MNADEIIDLLSLAAVFDTRTIGEADVHGWLAVAQKADWLPDIARCIVIEHYTAGAGRPRITPAQITDTTRDLRRRAAETFNAPKIPDSVADCDYPTWFRAQLKDHINRLLHAWTKGTPIPIQTPQSPSTDSLTSAAPPHLRAEIAAGLARIGRLPDRGTPAEAEATG